MVEKRKRLGELLIEHGIIDRHQLKSALGRQKLWGKRLGETLVEAGILTEDQLVKVLSRYLRIPMIDLKKHQPNPSVLAMLDGEFCRDHNLVPIAILKIANKNRLVIAVADPSEVTVQDQIQFKTNHPVALAIAPGSAIKETIRQFYFSAGKKDEITITRSIRPEDLKMRIIRDGLEETVNFTDADNVGTGTSKQQSAPRPSGSQDRTIVLIEMLVRKSILTRDEADHILSL